MKIKSFHIKNVRGLSDHHVVLDMIPNKPSLLVAPNGSGKSSFAFAFQWLNRLRMKLDEDDAYQGNVNNKPSMVIETSEPTESFCADENRNTIIRKFGIYVINNSLKPVSPRFIDGHAMGKARLTVPEITLIDHIPNNVQIDDDFDSIYNVNQATNGYYPVITQYITDNSFMASLDDERLKCTQRPLKKIANFIEITKTYTGTVSERHSYIETNDYNELHNIPAIAYAEGLFKKANPQDRNAKLLLRAIRLITLYYRKKDELRGRIEYSKYKQREQNCKNLFATLKQTWNNIAPHKEGNKVSLRINDAQRISNGERDIMVFVANLFKAKEALTKEYNILIIDEVFDYLDDANLMAAQYYITKMIKEMRDEGKNIFPIILSHLNPDYYNQHYSFKDLKVYYLCSLPYPHASDNMMKLLRKRKELSRAAGPGSEEDISKYMLHFYKDYSTDMSSHMTGSLSQWADINVFKQYCMNHLDAYLQNNAYDTLAVCVALREIIESRVYTQLLNIEQKETFLSKHGTQNKLEYAEEQGVDVPEIYYLLGNIYNDPMHVDNKSNKLITQTLYSRLENNTIRNMIKVVKENA